MLQARYQQLSDREKRLLWGGGFCALLLLGFLLIWRPLANANHALEAQVSEKAALVQWMQQAVAEVKRLRQQPGAGAASDRPLRQLITTQASRLQIKLERMQSQSDDEAQLWLKDVPFEQLLALLEGVSREGGQIAKTTIRSGSKPTLVDAQLTFRR